MGEDDRIAALEAERDALRQQLAAVDADDAALRVRSAALLDLTRASDLVQGEEFAPGYVDDERRDQAWRVWDQWIAAWAPVHDALPAEWWNYLINHQEMPNPALAADHPGVALLAVAEKAANLAELTDNPNTSGHTVAQCLRDSKAAVAAWREGK